MADDVFGKKREPLDLSRPLEDERGQSVSRARNRTVLLTPEVTGQVRSRLQEEEPVSAGAQDPVAEMLPPVRWDRPGTGSALVTPPTATPAADSAKAAVPFTPERFESVAPTSESDLRRATGKLATSPTLPPLTPANSGPASTRERAPTAHMTMQSRPAAPVTPGATPASPAASVAPVTKAPTAPAAPAASAGTRSDLKPWEQLLTDTNPSQSGQVKAAAPKAVEPAAPVKAERQPTQTPMKEAPIKEEQQMNASAQSMTAPQRTQVTPKPASGKIVGFLIGVSADGSSEVVELKVGRWLITSRPTDHGEYILLDDPTVSPLHAILRVTKDSKVQLLDQLSEHGTGVTHAGKTEEEELTGSMVNVNHGDLIRFGQKYFVACVIPAVKLPEAK